jgi:hypothetical protein
MPISASLIQIQGVPVHAAELDKFVASKMSTLAVGPTGCLVRGVSNFFLLK